VPKWPNAGHREHVGRYDKKMQLPIRSNVDGDGRVNPHQNNYILPIKDRGEELGNEPLVIWPEGFDFNGFVALAVQVVWVEGAYCS
jgi:hypothetical protein